MKYSFLLIADIQKGEIMPRNKYPEETKKKILDTALHLFMTQGYDNTSVQNIIDSLNGSKGAIYHHFNSKEEILEAVMQEMDKGAYAFLQSVKEDSSKTGYEKLQYIFCLISCQEKTGTSIQTAPDFRKNPQMLSRQLDAVYTRIVPDFILPMIEEGIADGSLRVEYPKEFAEMVSVLSVLWLNPLIAGKEETEESIQRRCTFFGDMMRKLGIAIDDKGECHEKTN